MNITETLQKQQALQARKTVLETMVAKAELRIKTYERKKSEDPKIEEMLDTEKKFLVKTKANLNGTAMTLDRIENHLTQLRSSAQNGRTASGKRIRL